jgi:predicted MFS family arabinose efflux permease
VWSLIPLFFYLATPENALPVMGVVWGISGVFPAAVSLAIPLVTARLSGLDKTMPAALTSIVISLGCAAGSAAGTLMLHTWKVRDVFMASFAGRSTVVLAMFLLLVYRPARMRRRSIAPGG